MKTSLTIAALLALALTTLGQGKVAFNLTLPAGMPGAAQYFFQVCVYEPADYTSSGYYVDMAYFGESPIFTCYASSVTAYYSLTQSTSPAYSTWAVGSQDESAATGLAGARGSIELTASLGSFTETFTPEPSSFSLLGLGALVLWGSSKGCPKKRAGLLRLGFGRCEH